MYILHIYIYIHMVIYNVYVQDCMTNMLSECTFQCCVYLGSIGLPGQTADMLIAFEKDWLLAELF